MFRECSQKLRENLEKKLFPLAAVLSRQLFDDVAPKLPENLENKLFPLFGVLSRQLFDDLAPKYLNSHVVFQPEGGLAVPAAPEEPVHEDEARLLGGGGEAGAQPHQGPGQGQGQACRRSQKDAGRDSTNKE